MMPITPVIDKSGPNNNAIDKYIKSYRMNVEQ